MSLLLPELNKEYYTNYPENSVFKVLKLSNYMQTETGKDLILTCEWVLYKGESCSDKFYQTLSKFNSDRV